MIQDFHERRSTPRSRVFFGGEILIDAELPPVECHVKNISNEGASLFVQSADPLPNQFDLFIRKTNERRRAVVTWNNGRQLGVAYRSPSPREEKWSLASMLQKMLGGADA
jgi:PilZ domain